MESGWRPHRMTPTNICRLGGYLRSLNVVRFARGRALEVREYLIEAGIAEERLMARC